MTKKVTKATEAQKKALGMCEHGHVNYKALEKLNSELYKALRLLRKDSSFKNNIRPCEIGTTDISRNVDVNNVML